MRTSFFVSFPIFCHNVFVFLLNVINYLSILAILLCIVFSLNQCIILWTRTKAGLKLNKNRTNPEVKQDPVSFSLFCAGGMKEKRSVAIIELVNSDTPATSPETLPSSPLTRSGSKQPISSAPPPAKSPLWTSWTWVRNQSLLKHKTLFSRAHKESSRKHQT